MTLTEARKILGLGPDEDPRPHMAELANAREKIADMVRSAPNENLAQKYQEGLEDFDRALAAVREYLEALGLIPKSEDVKVPAKGGPVFVAENEVEGTMVLPEVDEEPLETEKKIEEKPEKSMFRAVAWTLLILTVVGLGGWGLFHMKNERDMANAARVAFLEKQGAKFIENRSWPEAAETFDEIEEIWPDSALVDEGRRGIEAGMREEQSQYVGYWKGVAIASFEASLWGDAEKAANNVLKKYPKEEELKELLGKISEAKKEEVRQENFATVRKQVEEREFNAAILGAKKLIEADAEDTEATALLAEAEAAKAKAAVDLEKAKELLVLALEKDTGEYNEEELELLREAVALAPDDAEIVAEYQRVAAYTRTIRVPEDLETVEEALEAARDRDRIVLAEGTWEGPFVINAAVKLEGVSDKTIVQCKADAGSVITVMPGVRGARVSGMTLRHLSFDASEERFSLAMVRDATVDFADCRFEKGSGHGLAVTESGKAKVIRCRFSENGWNGIAVIGEGSLLEAEQNAVNGNYQNGIECWDGASLIASRNTCSGNSRNGIHVDIGTASLTVLDNIMSGNREFGVVISSSGSGRVAGNTLEKNLLGGMVVKAEVEGVQVTDNDITRNYGPGLVLEKGVKPEPLVGNRITGNSGDQLMSEVDLSGE